VIHQPSKFSSRATLLAFTTLLVGLLVVLSGCDNTVEPYGDRSDTYGIYGFITEQRSKQFIRVKRLDERLTDDDEPLDATVYLQNLTDGTDERLRDSMITFEDEGAAVVTHNYWTDTPIRPETTYRFVLEHPDGEKTTVTTTTPASVEAITAPDAGGCHTNFGVKFPPIEESRRVLVIIRFLYEVEENTVREFRLPWRNYRVGEEGSVVLRFEPWDLIQGFDDPECEKILSDFTIFYTYLGSEWYGRAPRDSVNFDPTESPYIDNGRGYFGSLWRDTTFVDYRRPTSGGGPQVREGR
jgi:hypothetical protein